MTPIIVLSSSPAPTFAPSPTQVNVSSPLRSSQETRIRTSTNDATDDVYDTVYKRREGFPPQFVTAKHVLTTRPNAENVPVGTSSPSKYKLTPPRNVFDFPAKPSVAKSPSTDVVDMRQEESDATACYPEWNELPQHTVVKVLPSDARKKRRIENAGSLNLKKATARKIDWTPTKPATQSRNFSGASLPSFSINLSESFGHVQSNNRSEERRSSTDGGSTKRRKIDLTNNGIEKLSTEPSAILKTKLKVASARKKSPVKKGLTITGLATSKFVEDNMDEQTPMMQFLVSTQAKAGVDELPETFEAKVKKNTLKPKKGSSKSRLKSPETVKKTLDSQEVIFGTASQLAREESPTLMKDTLEAIKQSEEHQFSSPIRSQNTASFSVESHTPKAYRAYGLRGRKSLWSAAHRGEDDALLHLDNGTDASIARAAFAGKDALVDHAALFPTHDSPDDSFALLAALNPDNSICDINDITRSPTSDPVPAQSPCQRRSYTTLTRSPDSKRTKSADPKASSKRDCAKNQSDNAISAVQDATSSKIPPKPNYAAWKDADLKEAVKAQGIKRVRARKTMIDKLDESWAEQHGLDPQVVKIATKRASQTTKVLCPSEILGTVHDVAVRPTVKSKKKGHNRGRSAKTVVAVLPNQNLDDIVDIADVDTTKLTAFDRLATIEAFPDEVESNDDVQANEIPPSTAPCKGTGVRATKIINRKNKRSQDIVQPLTPPPTIPQSISQTQTSSPGFEHLYDLSSKRTNRDPGLETSASGAWMTASVELSPSVANTDLPLKSRIREAIVQPSVEIKPRNHQTHPTWYEKILLYDPIILEDLTAWLNTEGFNSIGEDREIDVMQVRDWCHEQGVCCLWRGGWRGNKRQKTSVKDSTERE